MPAITHDIAIQATFRLTDDAGNTLGRHALPPMVLDALTPLGVLELYEVLHARRNEARKAAGFAELPSPDVAVVLLAALRRLGQETCIERIAEVVCEVVGEIARERGQLPHQPGWPVYPCPSCSAKNDIRGWERNEENASVFVCVSCGMEHTEKEWREWLFACDRSNGTQKPAEVT